MNRTSRKRGMPAWLRRVKRPAVQVEELESRIVLASPPSIVAVVPPATSTSTTLTVTYSEDVSGPGTASNYKLCNSSGAAIPITGDTYASATSTASLPLNAGNRQGLEPYT